MNMQISRFLCRLTHNPSIFTRSGHALWHFLCAVAFVLSMSMTSSANAAVGCYSGDVSGPKLITDICWDCLFPLRVAGVSISGETSGVPEGASKKSACMCWDTNNVPRPGISSGMWEPARLVEFQRVPGCSSVLNGVRFPFDRTFQGTHGYGSGGKQDGMFMHYHYYAFPLLVILDLFTSGWCQNDGYMDLDVMYMSELDPTWNNAELAFFANPEAAAVANPVAATACSADAVASATGNPIESMFWCAGSWGTLYPLVGSVPGNRGVIKGSSLLSARVLAALHRRGLAHGTMGDGAMCGGEITPTLPKSQYKLSILHPLPETKKGHKIGESTLIWGQARTIPAEGQDPIYTIWRWKDCCMTQ